MQIHSAQDLFNTELRAICSAEQKLSNVLPGFTQSVHADSVRQRLQERIEQGQDLLRRMDQLFDQAGIPKDSFRNETVEGMVQDMRTLMGSIDEDTVLDTAMIAAIQKIEHYCIAAWGTVAALGRTCGQQQVVDAFEKVLEQGKQFDKAMTALAENQVNPSAARSGPTTH